MTTWLIILLVVALTFGLVSLAESFPAPRAKHSSNEVEGEPTVTQSELVLPQRAEIELQLRQQFPGRADALLAQYDRLVRAIASQSFTSEELAAAFSDKIGGGALGECVCEVAASTQNIREDEHKMAA